VLEKTLDSSIQAGNRKRFQVGNPCLFFSTVHLGWCMYVCMYACMYLRIDVCIYPAPPWSIGLCWGGEDMTPGRGGFFSPNF